jgi:hypothetical protein
VSVHLTVPKQARLRREKPKWIVIHKADLASPDLTEYEGMPVTSMERTILDILNTTHRVDFVRQTITDARRQGYVNSDQAGRLRQIVTRYSRKLEGNVTKEGAIDSDSKAS